VFIGGGLLPKGDKIDRDLAELAIEKALSMGAEYSEARMECVNGTTLVMKNGNPEAAGFQRTTGLSVRVLAKGRMGFATTDQLARNDITDCAAMAVRMAKASAKKKKGNLALSREESHVKEYSVSQKEKIENVSIEDVLAALKSIDSAMLKVAPVASRFMQLEMEEREKYFVNSDGSRIGAHIPRIGMVIIPTIVERGQAMQAILQRGVAMGWEYMNVDKKSEEINHELEMAYKNMKEGKKSPKGKLDIVIGPEVAGIAAHESCGHPYEADRISGREAAQAGESFVKAKMLGTRIGSRYANVIDDPTLKNSYGFYLFDDEGVKARPKLLIKNGIINEFLHNRETAAEMGVKTGSNAAARAERFDREPIVRMSNTFIKPGDYKTDEIFEDIKLGVYMKSFNEWNIDDKRYNQRYVGREAYLIKDGEVKGAVKAPILELTTPAFWASIDACSRDLDFSSATCGKGEPMQGIPVNVGGPHVRLRGIRLGVPA
jgi:TldD protein